MRGRFSHAHRTTPDLVSITIMVRASSGCGVPLCARAQLLLDLVGFVCLIMGGPSSASQERSGPGVPASGIVEPPPVGA
jgi:hypothetical protein